MAITRNITKTLQHPTEPGVTVTIRMLSHYQVAMAEDRRFDAIAKKAVAVKDLAITDAGRTPEERAQAAKEAEKPENRLDRTTVLECGITSWSYSEALPDAIADLDEDTAAWLFREIIDFSFRRPDEKKESPTSSKDGLASAEAVGLPS